MVVDVDIAINLFAAQRPSKVLLYCKYIPTAF
jgi:hypothetical protein